MYKRQVAAIARSHDLIAHAEVVIVDGNLPIEVAEWVLAVASVAGARVLLEPVSVAKAARIAPMLRRDRPVFAITPNLDELAALAGEPVADTTEAITAAARRLQDRGVAYLWVSRGQRGSLLVGPGSSVEIAAVEAAVVDVTGAGDAMIAGFVRGLLDGESPQGCLLYTSRCV